MGIHTQDELLTPKGHVVQHVGLDRGPDPPHITGEHEEMDSVGTNCPKLLGRDGGTVGNGENRAEAMSRSISGLGMKFIQDLMEG